MHIVYCRANDKMSYFRKLKLISFARDQINMTLLCFVATFTCIISNRNKSYYLQYRYFNNNYIQQLLPDMYMMYY